MKDEEDEEEEVLTVSLNKLLSIEKEEAPSSTRLCLTPAAEGQLLLWIPEGGIKSSPHLSPGDDHSDDTNPSGGC